MTSESHQSVTPDELHYTRARWAFVLILGVLLLFDIRFPGGDSERPAYLVFLGMVLASTAYLWWQTHSDLRSSAKAMLWTLAPDLVAIGGFTYLLHENGDGFFPIVILFPVVYALVLSKREAWLVGGATSVAYILGHVFVHEFTMSGYLFFALKAISIPLVSVMVASSVARRRTHEEDARLAIAQREEALDQLGRRMQELQAVSEITEMVHSTLDFERVGPRVLEVLAKVIGLETCCLFVIDKEKSETLFSASIGAVDKLSTGGFARGDGGYPSSDDHFSCMAAFDHSETMVLFCADANDIENLTDEDRLVLSAVASELVVAVENSRLYKLTTKLAVTDELTGLANYRHLQNRLEEEIERARRYDKHLSLLMLDVDDFKDFNDRYGHIAGDAALAEIATVMERVVREVDLVARYGGEEFSVVLPETDTTGAFVAAEKIREAIAEHRLRDGAGDRCCHVTVSVGVATFPTHGVDREAILKEADGALYEAKSGGKNRVKTPRRGGEAEVAREEVPAVAVPDDEWTGA